MSDPNGFDNLGILGLAIFDVLCFVEHERIELQFLVTFGIPPDKRVTGHDQIMLRDFLKQ